jgi:hypothetical protein
VREITCPACGRTNRVAGYVPPPECQSEGKPLPPNLWCGFCGQPFTPAATPAAPVRDIMEG